MYEIILPTYNEEENIQSVLYMIHKTFKEINMDYKILMVDDNSKDNTFEKAIKMKKMVNVEILQREGKLGLGSAYKHALKYTKAKFIFIMDADMSHNPFYMKDMIEKQKINDCDIVIGTRYLKNERSGVSGWSFYRKLISRGANNLARILLNLKVSDVTGSYRLYKRNILKSLIDKVESDGFSYQMEVLYWAQRNKFSIAECPIVFVDRISGSSKMGLNEIIKFFFKIVILFFKI
ncbi:dolichol-phosphate mannosyltransferase [Hamiltosporidium magnivora]|uniref:Dolichol-phosphate mannosyltransferase subunit 1 n=1 Tax=Hamiltosporidium magnivora TaxID=148818 RepID=A0A4Q9L9B0_9MICR|nr:dolichol-phosphate mannosyltransferase [Hamiltosporidium magnivora]